MTSGEGEEILRPDKSGLRMTKGEGAVFITPADFTEHPRQSRDLAPLILR
jgi:hypothetical protein